MKKNRMQLAAVVLLCAAFILMGYVQWPGLHWDAGAFAPPVLTAGRGEGFLRAAYPTNARTEGDLYDYHGFFSLLLLGQLLGVKDWDEFILASSFVNAGSCLVWYLVFRRNLCSGQGWLSQCVPVLAGLAGGCMGVGLQGRPEQPAILIAALPFVFGTGSLLIRLASLSVCAGLLCCCSPSCGVMAGLGICVYLGLRKDYNSFFFVRWFFLGGLMSLLVFLATFLFTPITPLGWLSGTAAASSWADLSSHMVRFGVGGNGSWWGTAIIFPFWNVIVIFVFTLVCIRLLMQRRWIPLVFFVPVSARHLFVLTDYGYACAALPFAILLLRMAGTLGSSDNSLPICRIIRGCVCIWLFSFVAYFVQYATEAARVYYLPEVRPRVLSLFKELQAAEPVFGMRPVVGYMINSPQSYVTLGPGTTDFIAVNPRIDSAVWGPDDVAYFKKYNVFPAFIVVPWQAVSVADEFRIEGVRFRKYFTCPSYAEGVSVGRDRLAGYPLKVFRRE